MRFAYEEIGFDAATEAELELVKVESVDVEVDDPLLKDESIDKTWISLEEAWELYP